MITLKHLARTLDMDPYTLRQRLRAAKLSPLNNGRWKWPDTDHPQYLQALEAAKNSPASSSTPPAKPPPAPSPTTSSTPGPKTAKKPRPSATSRARRPPP